MTNHAIDSYLLNVEYGDSAVHVLYSETGGLFKLEAAVLIDVGRARFADPIHQFSSIYVTLTMTSVSRLLLSPTGIMTIIVKLGIQALGVNVFSDQFQERDDLIILLCIAVDGIVIGSPAVSQQPPSLAN
ncbi:hypothetical protein F5Y19DRAFT_473077 [Xylariaceae sp. FL1651]|nr:hypothetical protein F5Y19DRAFT_473077 [Xylariaceae sp. FL1651]